MKPIALSEALAIAVFVSFGLWWVVAPVSVIRFYNWFHRGLPRQPKPTVVRVIGALWIVLVVGVVLLSGQP
jgi:succinate-acetate transporter protein